MEMDKWFEFHIDLLNHKEYNSRYSFTQEDYKQIRQNVLGNEDLNNLLQSLIKSEMKKYKDNQKIERLHKYKVDVPSDKQMLCNICGNPMTHYNYNGTFIWVCEENEKLGSNNVGCANVQFELYDNTDMVELIQFLTIGYMGEVE